MTRRSSGHAGDPRATGPDERARARPGDRRRRRPLLGIDRLALVGAVLAAAVLVPASTWVVLRVHSGQGDGPPGSELPRTSAEVTHCRPSATHPGPDVDLNIQSATGRRGQPIQSRADVGRLVKLAVDAGASVISTTASFRTMQPRPGRPIDFSTLDRTVEAARSAGLRVRLQLVGMPAWALDEPGFALQPPRSDAELERWSGFVTRVLRHFAGDIDYLEVWNEPNQYKWWPTGPDPVQFTRLLDVTRTAVRAVDDSTQVVSGGLAGNDIGFLKATYDAVHSLGLRQAPFDLLGVHPWSGQTAPDEVDTARRFDRGQFGAYDGNFTGFLALRQVMTQNGDDSTPMYITQFGYSTEGRDALTDLTRADYLTRAFSTVTCHRFVSGLSWYALQPNPWDPPSYALVDASLRPDATYAALVAWSHQPA